MWLTGCESLEAVKESDLQKQVTFVNRLTYSYANLSSLNPTPEDSTQLLASIGPSQDRICSRLFESTSDKRCLFKTLVTCSSSKPRLHQQVPHVSTKSDVPTVEGLSQRRSLSKMMMAPFYGLFDSSWLNTSRASFQAAPLCSVASLQTWKCLSLTASR